jgi:superoxide dismutase
MAPPGSPNTSASAISANLSAAIDASFGGLEAFRAGFSGRAKALFGSGWVWLALSGQGGNASLALLTTANQDNPLMAPGLVRCRGRCPAHPGPLLLLRLPCGRARSRPPDSRRPGSARVAAALTTDRCWQPAQVGTPGRAVPILGLDVWEHAYYLKSRNERAAYVDAWWDAQVSLNYDSAAQGRVERLVEA